MRRAAFTVDVDRDVNLVQPGKREAASRPQDGDGSPRFSSSARGLSLLVDLLDDLGIRGTFFLEAVTAAHISESADLRDVLSGHEIASHGWEHEDLNEVSVDERVAADIIDRAADELERFTGRRPAGFRAPYQHVNAAVHRLLAERGYLYDSSITADIVSRAIAPYELECGLTEVPLARGVDRKGKHIHSYLWPMHEGKRRPDDYLHLIGQYDDGLLVLATHSWHVVETYREVLPPSAIVSQLDDVRAVLEGALDKGVEFNTLEGHLLGDGPHGRKRPAPDA